MAHNSPAGQRGGGGNRARIAAERGFGVFGCVPPLRAFEPFSGSYFDVLTVLRGGLPFRARSALVS